MSQFLKKRLENLENHLKAENPALLEVLPTYYKLDKILYRIGLLDRESSLASRISWWPLISVLGTFSSGKSTFINDYVGETLQDTGNQAVDDKFTVICYGAGATEGGQTLPGLALDADPRFPFFGISHEIEKVAKGEGNRIESYLQLRTTNQSKIKNKIIIDSPGFDADDQRRATLRITDRIIDLSDLVLIFFDARHPEPGAMQDTLEHLVKRTVSRADTAKFFYILNQIDTAAKDDNTEEIVGAWQRSMAQGGLSSGRFYTIYNEKASVPIEDEALRERFQSKRDADLKAIHDRMNEVEVQRNYRIVGVLETVANELEHDILPKLREAKASWRRGVLIGDGIALAGVVLLAVGLMSYFHWLPPAAIFTFEWLQTNLWNAIASVVAVIIMVGAFHYWVRGAVAKRVAAKLSEAYGQVELNLRQAFLKSAGGLHSIFRVEPVGWGTRAKKHMRMVREIAANHIQTLNDRFADPSGKSDVQIDEAAIEEAIAEEPAESPTE
ncbi:MAG: dynamin family protein [Rhodobacteraceae bacterium]|nr:dynamin family protein [Paracoccaceae bacterium]